MAGEVNDFDAASYLSAKHIRWTDRFSQFAVAAARLACEDAKLTIADGAADVGIFIGTALGGVAFGDGQHDVFRNAGLKAVKPQLALAVFGGASVSNVALALGTRGPVTANGNACAAGLMAVGDAFRAVARGDVRVAIAGGVEAPLSPLTFGAFTIIHAMSKRNDDPERASRPFDNQRDGFVMAEGAGIVIIEREEDAVRRDARIYGSIRGFGQSCDAHHMASPRPDGSCVERAMRDALSEAEVAPAQVDLVNAHASSTPLGDACEALAIENVLGEDTARVPIMATKGQHGHALGATGVWEIALTLQSMREKLLPRTVNFVAGDDSLKLNILRSPRNFSGSTALTNSSGFGGINAALVLHTA
jgi:3-oxoacyl-[acyl-carrier-protein] synthase II